MVEENTHAGHSASDTFRLTRILSHDAVYRHGRVHLWINPPETSYEQEASVDDSSWNASMSINSPNTFDTGSTLDEETLKKLTEMEKSKDTAAVSLLKNLNFLSDNDVDEAQSDDVKQTNNATDDVALQASAMADLSAWGVDSPDDITQNSSIDNTALQDSASAMADLSAWGEDMTKNLTPEIHIPETDISGANIADNAFVASSKVSGATPSQSLAPPALPSNAKNSATNAPAPDIVSIDNLLKNIGYIADSEPAISDDKMPSDVATDISAFKVSVATPAPQSLSSENDINIRNHNQESFDSMNKKDDLAKIKPQKTNFLSRVKTRIFNKKYANDMKIQGLKFQKAQVASQQTIPIADDIQLSDHHVHGEMQNSKAPQSSIAITGQAEKLTDIHPMDLQADTQTSKFAQDISNRTIEVIDDPIVKSTQLDPRSAELKAEHDAIFSELRNLLDIDPSPSELSRPIAPITPSEFDKKYHTPPAISLASESKYKSERLQNEPPQNPKVNPKVTAKKLPSAKPLKDSVSKDVANVPLGASPPPPSQEISGSRKLSNPVKPTLSPLARKIDAKLEANLADITAAQDARATHNSEK